MIPLSAIESISPALDRTRRILFHPFRWGTYLKLCAIAVLTEGFSSNFNRSHHGAPPPNFHPPASPFNLTPGWIAAMVAIGIAAILVCLALFYLVVRLRFVLFHCLTHRSSSIKEGWHLYRDHARRFFQFNLWVGVAYLMVAAALLAPFARKFIHIYQESRTAGYQLNFAELLPLGLQAIPLVLLLIVLAIGLDIVVRDFMLPHVALENAPVVEAWEAMLQRLGNETGAFILYIVLRLVLPTVAMIALFIVLAIPLAIVFAPLGVGIAVLHSSLVGATGPAVYFGTYLEVLLGYLTTGLGLLIAVCVGGPFCIAIRYWALVFYAGRYRPLGDLLDSPVQPPASIMPS